MNNLLKTVTALVLSAALLSPLGDMPLTVSSTAYAAEHICDEHCGEEPMSLELEEYSASTPAAPTASRKSGTISCTANSVSIKLSAAKGTTIYYSLNNADFKKYTGAIKLTKNSTIEAYAKINGKKSKTVTYTYKLTPSVKFNVTDTSSGKLVKLTTKVSGVKLYYTTDGSKPTTKSKAYTSSGINITKTSKLRVIAVKSGWANANFTKNYTVGSGSGTSTGTSDSSSDTKQLGASGFTAPSAGKATLRYNGENKTVDTNYLASHSDSDNVDYDWFKVAVSSNQYVSFTIAAGAKFNTGDTLTLSDMSGLGKGSGYVTLNGFGLKTGSAYAFSNSDSELYDKLEIKAVDMDYTGAKPSTIYFYILAHDKSGKKMSVEGLAKVNIKNSKHTGSGSGSGSGSSSGSGSGSGTGSSSTSSSTTDTKQLGASGFTTPSAGKATVRYNGESMTVNAKHEKASNTAGVKFDICTISLSDSQSISINIAADIDFDNGDIIRLSALHTKNQSCVRLEGFKLTGSSSVTTISETKIFDDVELKAVDMDYTGAKPSTIYFYILVHDASGKKMSLEGLAKVYLTGSKHGSVSSSSSGNGGSGSGSGSSGSGSGSSGSGSTSSGTGNSSSKTSYTSDITGNTFKIPDEGRANISYDGTEKTVPAKFAENTPAKYQNYDTILSVYLDGGTGKTSNEYIRFCLTADGWRAGTTLELGDLKGDKNNMSVVGIYQCYKQYSDTYIDSIFTEYDASYYDDVRFTIIDMDSSGDVLKYYFYVKIHDSRSSHTIEGVVNVREGAEVTPTADVGTGGGGGSVTVPTPDVHGSYACAVCKQGKCRPCDGTGKVWGWKEKVTCSYCHGTGICPDCNGTGTVYF